MTTRGAAARWALKRFQAAHDSRVEANRLDEEEMAAQTKLLEAFEQEILWPVDQALAEIEAYKKSGDVYHLSLVFKEHEKSFEGVEKFDMAVGTLGDELRSSEMRSAISAGKKFYAIIDQIKSFESRRKGPRSAADIKSMSVYLNRFAEREDDNIYGKAAALAAEKISDPDHAVASASSYIRLARSAE